MAPKQSIIVAPEYAGTRLDVWLAEKTGRTRSAIQKMIERGSVSLNGKQPKSAEKLRPGNLIEFEEPEPVETSLAAQDIPLNVLYEDADLLVIDKPAGMVVHPAAGNPDGTLVNALLAHCLDLAGIGGELRPGIVHRIDKDTSGLLVVAKNERALNHLAAQFSRHKLERRYEALVYGVMKPASGVIEGNIARHPADRKRFAVAEERGRRAVTHYETVANYGELSHLALRLETGRTHQIRVHLSCCNHPVVGDPVYCPARRASHLRDKALRDRIKSIHRQMLHAATLGFKHPTTGKTLRFQSEPPEDMKDLLKWLCARSEANE